jgi:hypothetical protein
MFVSWSAVRGFVVVELCGDMVVGALAVCGVAVVLELPDGILLDEQAATKMANARVLRRPRNNLLEPVKVALRTT